MTSLEIFELEYKNLIISYLKTGDKFGTKELDYHALQVLSSIYKKMGFSEEREKELIKEAQAIANFKPEF